MNSNFQTIGLTRLGMKLESTTPEADALNTRPSQLFTIVLSEQFLYYLTANIFKLLAEL